MMHCWFKKRSRKSRVSITRNGYVIILIFALNMDLINQIRKFFLFYKEIGSSGESVGKYFNLHPVRV